MGEKDTKSKEYLSDNNRFADACNYVLYDGRKVIRADDLVEQDSAEVLSILGIDEKEIRKQRWRDLLKRAIIKMSDDAIYVLLGIENQSEIHYAMPVKNMIYDALNYGSQVKEAAKLHKKHHDKQNSAEFLSGFKKTDNLTPIITITLYWGPEEWDGPLHLHDMFGGVDEELLKFIPDYHVNLIAPYAIDDFDKFETELGEVLEIIKCSNDEEMLEYLIRENPIFKEISNESVSAINLFTGLKIPLSKEKEVTDMCEAFERLKENYAREHAKEYAKEYVEEQAIINVKSLFENGGSLELAIATFKTLDGDTIKRIYQEHCVGNAES